MKPFIFNWHKTNYFCALLFVLFYQAGRSQTDTGLVKRSERDTSKMLMNLDAVYNRPFLQTGKIPVALGGYAEVNSNYRVVDGISEGLSFQMQRLTLFVSSSLHRKIKFLTEIEFEGGTKAINIEFAAIDFQFHPLLNFRGGIVMNPIGAFNQNHDGPRWEFVDRPLSATQLLPATFSNAGFGFYGKTYRPDFVWAYELYVSNGLNENLIANPQNKTYLPAMKSDPNRFEQNPNGLPMLSAKTSMRLKRLGELGLSYMGGVYNQFQSAGLELDSKRRSDVCALDFNTTLPGLNTSITTEFAWLWVDVPEDYSPTYGEKQWGGFLDIVQPLLRKKMFGFENASFNAALRVEYVDWNRDELKETGESIADDVLALVPALSFRTSSQTVIRLNYRYQWQRDFLGNPPSKTGALQFGLSTYF